MTAETCGCIRFWPSASRLIGEVDGDARPGVASPSKHRIARRPPAARHRWPVAGGPRDQFGQIDVGDDGRCSTILECWSQLVAWHTPNGFVGCSGAATRVDRRECSKQNGALSEPCSVLKRSDLEACRSAAVSCTLALRILAVASGVLQLLKRTAHTDKQKKGDASRRGKRVRLVTRSLLAPLHHLTAT